MTLLQIKTFWCLRIHEIRRVDPCLLELVPYKKRKEHRSWLSLAAVWGSSENLAICKLGRETLSEPNYTHTLISDFPPLEVWENKFLLFKLLSLWCFILSAQSDLTQIVSPLFSPNWEFIGVNANLWGHKLW